MDDDAQDDRIARYADMMAARRAGSHNENAGAAFPGGLADDARSAVRAPGGSRSCGSPLSYPTDRFPKLVLGRFARASRRVFLTRGPRGPLVCSNLEDAEASSGPSAQGALALAPGAARASFFHERRGARRSGPKTAAKPPKARIHPVAAAWSIAVGPIPKAAAILHNAPNTAQA